MIILLQSKDKRFYQKNFWKHQPRLPYNPNSIMSFNEISKDYLRDKALVEQMKEILKNYLIRTPLTSFLVEKYN